MNRNTLPLILLVTITLSSAAEASESRPAEKAKSELILLVQGGDCKDGVVHGADVTVSSGGGQERDRKTNNEGRAVFKGLPSGKVNVQVTVPGCIPAGKVYDLRAGPNKHTIELTRR